MEPRSAAVEHVAAPVEPVLAPVEKGSSPLEAPEALSFSGGLAFSPSGATTLPHINYACVLLKTVYLHFTVCIWYFATVFLIWESYLVNCVIFALFMMCKKCALCIKSKKSVCCLVYVKCGICLK